MVWALDLLREANRVFPETRIFWPAIAMVAVLAIIESLKIGWEVLALGAVAVFILLVLFFIISGIGTYLANPTIGNPALKYPAMVLVWAGTLGMCAFVGLCMSSFFFGKPRSMLELLTFTEPIAVHEKGEISEGPSHIVPLPTALPKAPAPSSGAARPQINADALNKCLNAIKLNDLSVSEVQARARQCLRVGP